MKKNESLSILYGILNLLDYLTTKKILKNGGYEKNPIANFLIKKKIFGVSKTISTAMGMTSIYSDDEQSNITKGLIGIYGLVVFNNLIQILKQKKSHQK